MHPIYFDSGGRALESEGCVRRCVFYARAWAQVTLTAAANEAILQVLTDIVGPRALCSVRKEAVIINH